MTDSSHLDLNECEEWGYCDQKCENTEGHYKCSCVDGYDLNDNNVCQAKLTFPKMKLLFTNTKSIYSIDKNGNAKRELLSNATSASGLDFHYRKQFLFYTDVGHDKKKVYQMQLDESGNHLSLKRDYR